MKYLMILFFVLLVIPSSAQETDCDEYLTSWQKVMDNYKEAWEQFGDDELSVLEFQYMIYNSQLELIQIIPPSCGQSLHIHSLTFFTVASKGIATVIWNEMGADAEVDIQGIVDEILELQKTINEDLKLLGWPEMEWK